MPTAAERQALAFLAGVALLGGGARVWMQRQGEGLQQNASTVTAESVDGQLSAVDSAKTNRWAKKRGAKLPKAPTARASTSRAAERVSAVEKGLEIIDVDIASGEELEKLPRIGPALAARIVANRDSLGPFGSLDALSQVRGIGPAMIKVLSPSITFSARPRQAISASRASKQRK